MRAPRMGAASGYEAYEYEEHEWIASARANAGASPRPGY